MLKDIILFFFVCYRVFTSNIWVTGIPQTKPQSAETSLLQITIPAW